MASAQNLSIRVNGLVDKIAAMRSELFRNVLTKQYELTDALSARPGDGKPHVVIANTIKGRGVSFMEDVAKWHHGVPSDAEYDKAIAELDAALAQAEAGAK